MKSELRRPAAGAGRRAGARVAERAAHRRARHARHPGRRRAGRLLRPLPAAAGARGGRAGGRAGRGSSPRTGSRRRSSSATLPLIPVFMVLIGWPPSPGWTASGGCCPGCPATSSTSSPGLPTLKVFGRAKAQAERSARITDEYRRATMRTLRIAFLSSFVLELLATLSVALVAVDDRAAAGPRRAGPVHRAGRADPRARGVPAAAAGGRPVPRGGRGARRGRGGLRRAGDRPRRRRARGAVPDAAAIAFEGVTVRYPGRPRTPSPDVSFAVAPGETVALVGPERGRQVHAAERAARASSGPTAGRVRVGGSRPRRRSTWSGWRAQIAWVPQRPHLFAGTIAENVRLARPDADDAAVRRGAARTRARWTSSTRCPTARTPCSARTAPGCRPASGSGSRWPGRSSPTGRCCCSTSRRPRWTGRPRRRSSTAVRRLAVRPHGAAGRAPAGAAGGGGPRGAAGAGPAAAGRRRTPVRRRRTPGGPRPAGRPAPSAGDGPAAPHPPGASGRRASARRARACRGARRGRLALALLLGSLALGSAVGLMATSGWLISRASQQPPVLYLMVAVTATRAFGIGRAVFRYAERLVSHDAVLRMLADIRVAVYRRLERLAPAGLRAHPPRRPALPARRRRGRPAGLLAALAAARPAPRSSVSAGVRRLHRVAAARGRCRARRRAAGRRGRRARCSPAPSPAAPSAGWPPPAASWPPGWSTCSPAPPS